MEYLKTTEIEPNSELNKSTIAQRLKAYIANKTQPTVMEKLNSAIANLKRLLMEKAHQNDAIWTVMRMLSSLEALCDGVRRSNG